MLPSVLTEYAIQPCISTAILGVAPALFRLLRLPVEVRLDCLALPGAGVVVHERHEHVALGRTASSAS